MSMTGDPTALSGATNRALANQTMLANEQVRQGELTTQTSLDNMQKMGDAQRITQTASTIRNIHKMAQDLAHQDSKLSKEVAGKWTNM